MRQIAPYLEKKLDELAEKHSCIVARRGKGLMQGLVITGFPVGQLVTKALEKGLVVISAGSDVLRLVPPLVIQEKHVDEMIVRLEEAIKELEA